MKHKTMRRLLYLVCAFAMALCLAFTACNKKEETPATVTATATFVGGTDATGTPPAPISVDAGTEITLPQNTFQKSGSAFDGWNDGAATYAEGAKYTLSKDTTFTALWKTSTPVPVTYTLTFALGDHAAADASVPAAQTLEAGATCNLPAAPKAAEGWQFDGWGSDKLAAGASYTMPASDTTLTAQWKSVEPDTPTPTTYTVTVSGEGFTVSGLNANYEAGASVSFTVTVTDTEKEIDTVTSSDVTVTKNADGSYGFTMPEKNVTVTVTLKDKTVTPPPAPTTYTVTVASGEGYTVSGLNADGYEAGASVSFTVTVTDDSKEIDTVTSSDVTVNKNSDGSYGFTMPEKNVSVTVTLKDKTVTPVTYTLTFALGDHAAADATAPAAQTLAAGATYDLPDGPAAADGWQFDGWGSDKLAAGTSYTMPASDTTLTAQWKEVTATPVTEYTISYSYAAIYGQSTVEGNAPASPVSAKAGDSVTLPACGWTCLGYTFKGWSVQHLVNGEWKNIDDTLYQAEETFTMPDENVNLRANWSLASVTLKFDSNGGSGATDGFSFLFGVSFADRLSKVTPAFTFEGHAFAGWSYTADGEALDLTDADLFKLDAYKAYVKAENGSYTLTLYTVWGLGISYSYGYIPATETVQGSAPTSPVAADQGDEITFPECTWVRKGYTFAGWKVQRWIEDVVNYPKTRGYWKNITEDVYQPGATYTMPGESIRLLATWTKATVTLKFDANEGEGEIPSTTFNYGDSFTSKVKFLDNTFNYAGHRFVGWAYTPSGPAVDEYSYTWNACKDYVVEENGAFSLTLYAIWEIGSTPAPTTSFSDLCGVWVNGNSTIVLSETGKDAIDDEYAAGTAVLDGKLFYELIMIDNQIGDVDSYGGVFLITVNSATSITYNDLTYTKTASSTPITAADLEGKWNATTGTSSFTFKNGQATYSVNGADNNVTMLLIDKYVVLEYVASRYASTVFVLSLNEDKDTLSGYSCYTEQEPVARTYTKETTTEEPEPEPAEGTKYTGNATYTFMGTSYTFTSVTIDTSKPVTTAHIEYTVGVGSESISTDFDLDDNTNYADYYTGEGTVKYYYTFTIGNIDFNIAVLDGEDAIVLCNNQDDPLQGGKFLPEGTGPVTPTTYTVTVSGNGFTVSGLNANYEAGASVSFTVTVTDDSKEIDTVTSSDVTVTKNADGSYSFTMPEKNVTVTVTLKDKQTEPAGDVFTGHATYTSTLGTFVFTSVTIDTSKAVTTATIEATLDGQPIDTNVVELTNRALWYYSGEGTLVYYYTFSIKVSPRSQEFALGVFEGGNAIVICDTLNADELPIEGGKFTKAGSVEPEPEVQHTVTYELGAHAAEGATAPDAAEYAKDATVTVEAGVEGEIGYEFTGWSDGKGHTYHAGETFTMPDEDVTLTAQYDAYTPTTKTLDDYLGVWKAPDGVDTAKDVSRIKIEKNGDVYTVSYENKYDEGNFVTIKFKETTAKKCLILTAEKEGMIPSMSWTLTMTFTDDEEATVEINGVTSVFTLEEKGTPGTGTDEPDKPVTPKPEDADGTYVNAEGTKDLDQYCTQGNGDYDYVKAELNGNTLTLTTRGEYAEPITLTWDANGGNVATGEIFYYGSTIKVQVEAKEGQLEITFTYNSKGFSATFTKQASGSQGGGSDGGDGGDHGDSGDTQSYTLNDFFNVPFGYDSMESSGWTSTTEYGNTVMDDSGYSTYWVYNLTWKQNSDGLYYLYGLYINSSGKTSNTFGAFTRSYYLRDSSNNPITASNGDMGIDATFNIFPGASSDQDAIIGTVKFSVNAEGKKQITFTINGHDYTLVELA